MPSVIGAGSLSRKVRRQTHKHAQDSRSEVSRGIGDPYAAPRAGPNSQYRADEPAPLVSVRGSDTRLRIRRVLGIPVSASDLQARFSADAFNKAEIYPRPRPGGWDEGEIQGVYHVFPKLVRFFEEAATTGEVVVVYAT